jgi:hypothetical protein
MKTYTDFKNRPLQLICRTFKFHRRNLIILKQDSHSISDQQRSLEKITPKIVIMLDMRDPNSFLIITEIEETI